MWTLSGLALLEVAGLAIGIVVGWLFADRDSETEQVRETRRTLFTLADAVQRGGLDVSPCLVCGRPVVCLPDGLPMCDACALEARDDGD